MLSPDRKLLATWPEPQNETDTTPVEVWSVDSQKSLAKFPGHWNRIEHLAFSHDGAKLATLGGLGLTKIWAIPQETDAALTDAAK
jgi:WD40 repeat protein